MSELSRYEPAYLSASTHPNFPGNFDVKGEIEIHDASARCYRIKPMEIVFSTLSPCTVSMIHVTSDIYDALDEKFTPGQHVVVTVCEMEPNYARNLRSMTEEEGLAFQAELDRVRAGQTAWSQPQGGSLAADGAEKHGESKQGGSPSRRGWSLILQWLS